MKRGDWYFLYRTKKPVCIKVTKMFHYQSRELVPFKSEMFCFVCICWGLYLTVWLIFWKQLASLEFSVKVNKIFMLGRFHEVLLKVTIRKFTNNGIIWVFFQETFKQPGWKNISNEGIISQRSQPEVFSKVVFGYQLVKECRNGCHQNFLMYFLKSKFTWLFVRIPFPIWWPNSLKELWAIRDDKYPCSYQ